MHSRRYFVKALEGGDERAALPLAGYKKLFEIEAKVRDLDDVGQLAARQAEGRPVYDSLLRWCRTYQAEERPTSPLARAIGYVLNHEEALTRFLTDGCIPIDNGAAERLHVRVALTRKNHLFAGRAAIAYTILGSCRLAGVNPVDYLADVLPRLARGVRSSGARKLLPAAWRAQKIADESSAASE